MVRREQYRQCSFSPHLRYPRLSLEGGLWDGNEMEMGSLRVTNTSCKWSKWLKWKIKTQKKDRGYGSGLLIQIITDDAGGRTDNQVRARVIIIAKEVKYVL